VNEVGTYEQATDQESIAHDFRVLKLSDESDLYGVEREVLGPVSDSERLQWGEA
jgi:hypothetical protein